jgi:type IV secretory pathway VirB9-like protein
MKPLASIGQWAALIGVYVLLSIAGPVNAESLPLRGTADSRIRSATYSPDEVYRLYGFVGYAIELIFEDGESFA